MIPAEDNTWPVCPSHQMRHWCDVTRDYFISGSDSDNMCDGLRYCVPAVPLYNLYAEVSIGDEVLPGIAWELALVVQKPDMTLFGMENEEDFISLGLWTPGEGRLIIASAIDDWAEGYADPKCVNTKHGFPEEMQHQVMEKADTDGLYAKANRWCLAYYKKCYQCYVKPAPVNAPQIPRPDSGPDSWNASSFGVNPDDFKGGGRRPSSGRQDRARDALRQRYSQRIMSGQDPVSDSSDNNWPDGRFM